MNNTQLCVKMKATSYSHTHFLTHTHTKTKMSPKQLLHNILFFSLLIIFLPVLTRGLPDPNPEAVQPFQPKPKNTTPTTTSPPATIPAFPEQSNLAGCPLDLPPESFRAIKTSCSGRPFGQLHKSRCCPVLAAWLYSAYSSTALSSQLPHTNTSNGSTKTPTPTTITTVPYDMPLLPDDSETCVESLEKGMRERVGMELVRPNESCDLLSCYCGIRLHPLSCPEFGLVVNRKGQVVGDKSVRKLERDCFSASNSNNNKHFSSSPIGSCSKCFNSLYLLTNKMTLNTSKYDERTTKMRNKDCQLMGLTWLLAKNRTAYIHTVSAVFRAMMMSTDGGSDTRSCALNSDGMPLAVDSSQISNTSFSINREVPIYVSIALIFLLNFLFKVCSSRF